MMEFIRMVKNLPHYRLLRNLAVALVSCLILVAIVYFTSIYNGRVIDAKTRQPISGAVIVGYWSFGIPTAGGTVTKCLDARETVSNDKGEFRIPISFFGEIFGEMQFAIYKVGYERVECYWESLDDAGGCMMEEAQWEGNRAIIKLESWKKIKGHAWKGGPPSVCGRRDRKPLSALRKEEDEYRRIVMLDKN